MQYWKQDNITSIFFTNQATWNSWRSPPPNKRVKYSEVHERLHNRFDVSAVHTTKILRTAFPLAEKKRSGREKHCYYTGITWKSSPLSSLHCTTQSPSQSPTQPSSQPSTSLVPQSSLETPSVGELLERNRTLECQIRDLEEKIESQQAVISHHQLQQEVAFLVQSQGQVIHGPDTPEHFRSFSLEQVCNEVQCGAPMLYELMQTLGDTRRNVEDDGGMTVEEMKALMSCCILLNARSRNVNVIQLLLSFMLVTRGITKQVGTCLASFPCPGFITCSYFQVGCPNTELQNQPIKLAEGWASVFFDRSINPKSKTCNSDRLILKEYSIIKIKQPNWHLFLL